MTDKYHYLHMHMVKVFEWHGYLETFCLNLQDKWKKDKHIPLLSYKRERFNLEIIVHHEHPQFALFQKSEKPPNSKKDDLH